MADAMMLLITLFEKSLEGLQGESEGLTNPQYKMLAFLKHHDRPSVGSIAQAFGISNPAATKALDRLVAKGLIERKENPEDRRTLLLALTEAGEKAMAGYFEETKGRFDRILAGMRPEEKRALKKGIRAFLSASFLDDQALMGRLCLHCGDEHTPDCVVHQASLALLEQPIAEV